MATSQLNVAVANNVPASFFKYAFVAVQLELLFTVFTVKSYIACSLSPLLSGIFVLLSNSIWSSSVVYIIVPNSVPFHVCPYLVVVCLLLYHIL